MWRIQSQLIHHQRALTCLSQQVCRHASQAGTLAIRREDNSVWERRAPLAPNHVRKLVRQGFKVIVQPSNRRAYPMQEYANVGAHIQEDLSSASVILGVKQVPIDLLEADKTYVFFSHTIKAQDANMPMLDAILEKRIRLIDYERMVDGNGRRVVAFGQYAGVAGMINILHGMGLRLLALGHHTPFMHVGPAHNYRNSGSARQAIRDAGYEIALGLMPRSIGPLTFVFTGSGNVSQGAQEVFQELPHEYVEPEHLPKVAKHGAIDKVYACVVSREDHLWRKEGGGFDPVEFDAHPEKYASTFYKKIAPYASCIINGIYYAPNAPRLITIPEAKSLARSQKQPWLPVSAGCPPLPHRLLAICDISADPGGSIEFMKECTTIDKPFCLYDADENMDYERFDGDGVLVCSIDNMPTQIPREATDFFGTLLFPYVNDIMLSDATQPFESFQANSVVKSAVIASNGSLTPNFEYIDKLKHEMRKSSDDGSGMKDSSHKAHVIAESSRKRVLVLGAGYVSAPVVDYLSRDDNVAITVTSQFKEEVDRLAESYPNTTPVMLELNRSHDEIENFIKDHDVVISLLPYDLHPSVAKMCIKHKTNMVTASYCSQAMMALNQAAVDAGITVLNEIGVDPGIDHLLAMQCFDEAEEHGGKITSYVSWCGGLPAPEFSDNPLRYKFSWSPVAVLRNILSNARYLQNGKIVDIGEGGELLNSVQDLHFLPGFNLEGFPNRDSLVYADLYNIQNVKTILRGTLRFKGFSRAAAALLRMGLISLEDHNLLHPGGPDITWRAFMCELLGQKPDILVDSLHSLVHEYLGRDDFMFEAIEGLGLLSDNIVDKKGSPLATLSNFLANRLAYGPGERDLICMHHEVGIQWPDNSKETHNIDFVVYGQEKGYSAMAATVGFPTGIATRMVLDGEIQKKGMVLPFSRDIYRPMLKRLKQEGLEAKTSVVAQ